MLLDQPTQWITFLKDDVRQRGRPVACRPLTTTKTKEVNHFPRKLTTEVDGRRFTGLCWIFSSVGVTVVPSSFTVKFTPISPFSPRTRCLRNVDQSPPTTLRAAAQRSAISHCQRATYLVRRNNRTDVTMTFLLRYSLITTISFFDLILV